MSKPEFLKKIENTKITPKMQKVINQRIARFFDKTKDDEFDYDVFNSIVNCNSFTPFERVVIAYKVYKKFLTDNKMYEDSFWSYWYNTF